MGAKRQNARWKLLVGAPPMREIPAMRPSFLDPDAKGAFADQALVRPRREFNRWRTSPRERAAFFMTR